MKKETETMDEETPPAKEEVDDTKGEMDEGGGGDKEGSSKEEAGENEGEEKAETDAEAEGVKISEEFQQEAHGLINEATKAECDYLRSCLSEREDAMRKEEMSKNKSKGKASLSTPNTFGGSMPSYD